MRKALTASTPALRRVCEFDPPSRVWRVNVVADDMSVRYFFKNEVRSALFAYWSSYPETPMAFVDWVAGVVGMPYCAWRQAGVTDRAQDEGMVARLASLTTASEVTSVLIGALRTTFCELPLGKLRIISDKGLGEESKKAHEMPGYMSSTWP
jgi:hypothetical protein